MGRIDGMSGAYLGPRFSEADIRLHLDSVGARYTRMDDPELLSYVAQILAQENVVGWCQGRMEFGPRALGGRSIIGDARSPKMQSQMNLKIKYRRILPSVRAGGARGTGGGLFRTRPTKPLHAARGPGREGAPPSHDIGAGRPLRHREA